MDMSFDPVSIIALCFAFTNIGNGCIHFHISQTGLHGCCSRINLVAGKLCRGRSHPSTNTHTQKHTDFLLSLPSLTGVIHHTSCPSVPPYVLCWHQRIKTSVTPKLRAPVFWDFCPGASWSPKHQYQHPSLTKGLSTWTTLVFSQKQQEVRHRDTKVNFNSDSSLCECVCVNGSRGLLEFPLMVVSHLKEITNKSQLILTHGKCLTSRLG